MIEKYPENYNSESDWNGEFVALHWSIGEQHEVKENKSRRSVEKQSILRNETLSPPFAICTDNN